MCHGHRYQERTVGFEAPAERRDVRASDEERDRAVEQLRVHAQAGRLTSDELEERVEQALHAKTRADLDALQHDLPAERRPVARQTVRRTHHGPGLMPIAFLLIVIWAVTGAGYFWPIWPLLWFAFIGFGRVSHMRVTSNSRRTW